MGPSGAETVTGQGPGGAMRRKLGGALGAAPRLGPVRTALGTWSPTAVGRGLAFISLPMPEAVSPTSGGAAATTSTQGRRGSEGERRGITERPSALA